MKTVGQKGDEDVCLDAMGKLMKMGRIPKSPFRFLKASSISVSWVYIPKAWLRLAEQGSPQQIWL
jgi:hypothetical protein